MFAVLCGELLSNTFLVSLSFVSNFLSSAFVVFIFPFIGSNAWWIYFFVSFVLFIWLFKNIIETKGKSITEIYNEINNIQLDK